MSRFDIFMGTLAIIALLVAMIVRLATS